MDSDQPSLDLLSHFDRPKTLSPAEYREPDWQPLALPRVSSVRDVNTSQERPAELAAVEHSPERPSQQICRRDGRWVLKWGAAVSVIAVAASQLIAFAYICQGEHALDSAARAGASESILPRATYETISAAIERRLATCLQLGSQLQVTILQNGRPIGQRFRIGEDDRISVIISAPASAMTPSWLAKLPLWRGDVLISARADRTMPSRKLRPEHSQTAAE
ncbi:MAG TPA: hypothetical protein VH107_09695 [Lacipirellulaceae bacterium]|jgi:hypothetical protein|nr:hypothetical protein [Lacipirellulaceae bacterium]